MGLSRLQIERAIKARPKLGEKRIALRDDDPRGLKLLIGPQSAVWYLEGRRAGKTPEGRRWPTRPFRLGDIHTHSLDEARRSAQLLRRQLAEGTVETEATQRSVKEAWAVTSAVRLGEYIEVLRTAGKSQSTLGATEIQVRQGLASVGLFDQSPSKVTEAHLREIIDLAKAGSKKARYGYLSRFLAWCGSRGYSPKFRVIALETGERPKAPRSRDRALSARELETVYRAVSSSGADEVSKEFVRFLIAVPCRRGEAAAMTWREVDIDGAVWDQSSGKTKNRTKHRFHLNAPAMAIIRRRRAASKKSPFVFPSPVTGGVLNGFKNLKHGIDTACDPALDPWVFHDLRRTFATTCAEHLAVDETVADLILNDKASSSRGGIRGVYQTSSRWAERVAALDEWGKFIAKHGASL